MIIVYVLVAIAALGLICAVTSVWVVRQFERGVVFRFGRVRAMTRGPGLVLMATSRGPAAEGQHADRDPAGARPGRHPGSGSTRAWSR